VEYPAPPAEYTVVPAPPVTVVEPDGPEAVPPVPAPDPALAVKVPKDVVTVELFPVCPVKEKFKPPDLKNTLPEPPPPHTCMVSVLYEEGGVKVYVPGVEYVCDPGKTLLPRNIPIPGIIMQLHGT
jgi:hypothetical protein